MDPNWLLGTDARERFIIHVRKGDSNRLVFENAQQLLGAEHHQNKS